MHRPSSDHHKEGQPLHPAPDGLRDVDWQTHIDLVRSTERQDATLTRPVRALRKVRLLKPYERDVEWWVTHPADPPWQDHDAGEVLWVSDEEARMLIDGGTAELVDGADG